MKSERYGVYGILDIYFLLHSIFNRSSDNQLVFRWIQTSFFDLPVDQHSTFEIRYSKFGIRNSEFEIRSVGFLKFEIRFRIYFLTFADLY